MAEKPPVRLAPPFGGITRIRFKGSPAPFQQSADLSAICGSPALRLQNKTRVREVNCSHNGHKGAQSSMTLCPSWTWC